MARQNQRGADVEIRVRQPSAFAQLDSLLEAGLQRIEFMSPRLSRGEIALVFKGDASRSVAAVELGLIHCCEQAALDVLPSETRRPRDCNEEDEALDIRAW